MTAMVMTMILTRLTADPPPRRAECPNRLRGLHFIGVKPGLSTPFGSLSAARKNCLPPELYATSPREVRRHNKADLPIPTGV